MTRFIKGDDRMNEICFRTLHLDKPWTLSTYESAGGYVQWKKILRENIAPEKIREAVKVSALRGRGCDTT